MTRSEAEDEGMNKVELTVTHLATTAYISKSQRREQVEIKAKAIGGDTRVMLRHVGYQRPVSSRRHARPPPSRVTRVVSTRKYSLCRLLPKHCESYDDEAPSDFCPKSFLPLGGLWRHAFHSPACTVGYRVSIYSFSRL